MNAIRFATNVLVWLIGEQKKWLTKDALGFKLDHLKGASTLTGVPKVKWLEGIFMTNIPNNVNLQNKISIVKIIPEKINAI